MDILKSDDGRCIDERLTAENGETSKNGVVAGCSRREQHNGSY